MAAGKQEYASQNKARQPYDWETIEGEGEQAAQPRIAIEALAAANGKIYRGRPDIEEDEAVNEEDEDSPELGEDEGLPCPLTHAEEEGGAAKEPKDDGRNAP